MSESFEGFLCKYIQRHIGVLSRYLLAALDNQEKNLYYLDMSLGTVVPSIDIRNCELLTDAGLFCEEVKVTRDGRNRYKLFYLTALGRKMVEKIKKESYTEELPESPPIAPPEEKG